jgi:hypothetical protein
MPPYTRGKKRNVLTYVKVNPLITYAWNAKDLSSIPGIGENDLTAIGHQKAEGASLAAGSIVIIGASAPQPPRVTKKLSNAGALQQQSVSTFAAFDKLATMGSAGWQLSKPRKSVNFTAPNANRGTHTAIATLTGGILYAFPMNKADFDDYKTALGLESSTVITSDTERNKLVSGSTKPRPGVAKRKLDDGSTFRSFFSTTKLSDVIEAGFDIISEEVLLTVAAAGGGS